MARKPQLFLLNISIHVVQVSLLFTLSKFHTCLSVATLDLEQVNADWAAANTVKYCKVLRCRGTLARSWLDPANIYLFKLSTRDTRKTCGIYLKLTIKTPIQRFTPFAGVSIVNRQYLTSNLWQLSRNYFIMDLN